MFSLVPTVCATCLLVRRWLFRCPPLCSMPICVALELDVTLCIGAPQRVSECLLFRVIQANGKLPKHIVIMRDGVSESQFRMVIDQELADLQRACQAVDKSYRPTLTVLIVQKRHGTRFYAEDANFPGVNRGNHLILGWRNQRLPVSGIYPIDQLQQFRGLFMASSVSEGGTILWCLWSKLTSNSGELAPPFISNIFSESHFRHVLVQN
uniref:Piwi domain-containing protein n=1 Tax=Ditylenchus dipsaci TaxID=166011 RepID=A0A915DSB2_9BILA